MKILHILASNKFSGAENVVCQIINMFSGERNIEMIYCSPDGDIREALSERGVTFAPISTLSAKEVKRVILETHPDIVHAHDMRASFIAARVSGQIPFISHIHGNFAGLNKITPKAIAYALAAFRAKHIFWVSKSSYDGYVFKKIAAKKSSILPNVINIEELHKKAFSDDKKYNYDVIFLGRLTQPKNPERLIRVLKLLVEKRPETRIAIVGTGELEASTKAVAEELGINKNIDFLGFLHNPLKVLHDSKVMIMTSIREGTPMCALEAMALGVPIVSTPTDGLQELVQNGRNGYLSDEDFDLMEKTVQIISDSALRKMLSDNSKKMSVELNSIEKYREKIAYIYGGMISK